MKRGLIKKYLFKILDIITDRYIQALNNFSVYFWDNKYLIINIEQPPQ